MPFPPVENMLVLKIWMIALRRWQQTRTKKSKLSRASNKMEMSRLWSRMGKYNQFNVSYSQEDRHTTVKQKLQGRDIFQSEYVKFPCSFWIDLGKIGPILIIARFPAWGICYIESYKSSASFYSNKNFKDIQAFQSLSMNNFLRKHSTLYNY